MISEAQLFTDDDDVKLDCARLLVQNSGNVADTGRALAVHAYACHSAGIGAVQPLVVNGGRIHFNPLHGCIQVGCDFVDARNDHHLLRAEGHGGNPVADAVRVDKLPVHRDCVGA